MDGNGHFHSQTFGTCDLPTVQKHITHYLDQEPARKYRVVIGTDSQAKNSHATDFVIAIVIHRVGAGGIYFWKRIAEEKRYALKERMYQEALLSLATADECLTLLKSNGFTKMDLEIHVDIGPKGETRSMITEIVGMIRGSGFVVKTKPDSFGASKVADRHT